MANTFGTLIWVIDTVGIVSLASVNISALKWISISGALGDRAVLQDGFGNPLWEGVCSGPDFDTGVFTLGGQRTVQGLKMATLGSGKIYIYQQ